MSARAKCITDVNVPKDKPLGFAGSLVRGPALRGGAAELTAILPPPVKT